MAAVTLVLMASVLGRYSGLFTLVWAEEAARAMFIWLVMLGAAVAVERDGHFRLDVLEHLLPRAGARALQALAHLAMGLFGVALLVTGAELLRNGAGQYTMALGLPQGTIDAAVLFGGLLFVLYAARRLHALYAPGVVAVAQRADDGREG